VPDETARQHFLGFFPDLRIEVREHPEDTAEIEISPVRRQPDETLRVAIIGAIGPHKGARILENCAADAMQRKLPIEFHLIGYADRETLADMPNVNVTGRYKEEELAGLLEAHRCHIAFLPSPWPETYSYTLSEAWNAGLFPVAFDLGAMARRIRQQNWGHLIPIDLAASYQAINDILLSLDPPPRPDGFRLQRHYASIWSDYYGLDCVLANHKLAASA
jgi:glycosyltransferase involved in cell wall biosynthesis